MVFIFRSLNLYKQKFIRQYRHLVEKFGALHNEFPSSLNLQHFLIKQNLKYTLNDANLNLHLPVRPTGDKPTFIHAKAANNDYFHD